MKSFRVAAGHVLHKFVVWVHYCQTKQFGGVRISPNSIWVDEPQDFFDQVVKALEFIRTHDPRRLQLIERHLDFIFSCEIIQASGMYFHAYRACYVNYHALHLCYVGSYEMTPRAQQVLTMELARVVIHEMTHARIERAGIRYTPENRERIEKLCRKQEVSFLRKAAPNFTDLFDDNIDWDADCDFEKDRTLYDQYWAKTRTQIVRDVWRTAFDSIRPAPEHTLAPNLWSQQHREFWEAAQQPQVITTEALLDGRGASLFAAKQFCQSVRDYRVLAEKDPQNLVRTEMLALVLSNNRQYEESYETWWRAHELGSANAISWIFHLLLRMDRFEQALQLQDDNREAIAESCTCRATALIRLHRYDEAVCYLDDVIGETEIAEFNDLTTRCWLLRHINRTERFQEDWELVASRRDWWLACCEPEAKLRTAYVLDAADRIRKEGVLSCRAVLLVCPEDDDSPELRDCLDRTANRILETTKCDLKVYENAYLQSLLYENDDYPWRDVPADLTEGRAFFVVDAQLSRVLLPNGRLQGDVLPLWVRENDADCDMRYEAILASSFDHSDETPAVSCEFMNVDAMLSCATETIEVA